MICNENFMPYCNKMSKIDVDAKYLLNGVFYLNVTKMQV